MTSTPTTAPSTTNMTSTRPLPLTPPSPLPSGSLPPPHPEGVQVPLIWCGFWYSRVLYTSPYVSQQASRHGRRRWLNYPWMFRMTLIVAITLPLLCLTEYSCGSSYIMGNKKIYKMSRLTIKQHSRTHKWNKWKMYENNWAFLHPCNLTSLQNLDISDKRNFHRKVNTLVKKSKFLERMKS